MKLWQKNTNVAAAVENFTVGNDPAFDAMLAPFDVLGSLAHVRMLAQVGLLESSEAQLIDAALKNIYKQITITKSSSSHRFCCDR